MLHQRQPVEAMVKTRCNSGCKPERQLKSRNAGSLSRAKTEAGRSYVYACLFFLIASAEVQGHRRVCP